ncbi:EDD domain protein [Paenibacillus selenitireducens]|jgi:DegV family protein with EDD domain|uniref:EDD domain protein n=1 Tax=Paenibacillus selenitireducens TaxID=1324314 RepID=A0A1T2XN42_9BACL|nr:DegV family protein [Paenibacillus selenitireducens]OPA81290.1 EDD domain protein [Paenibacillus selenitireducens]
MTIKIITDGSSDLTQELAQQHQLSIVPLRVQFGHEQFNSTMDTDLFYAKMRESEELPKTSSPSPIEFLEQYKRAAPEQPILVLALSSVLSSTYQHAVMAIEMFREEGYQNPVEVLDVKTTSVGLGLIAIRASEWKDHMPFADLVTRMHQLIETTQTLFTLDTLENVIKGGRLSRLKGKVASVLNIKLLMHASEEGAVEVLEKLRGTQKAMKHLMDKVGDAWSHSDKKWIACAHSNCEERAKTFMKELLHKYPFDKVIIMNMGPVIGTYAGEGGILVSYSS